MQIKIIINIISHVNIIITCFSCYLNYYYFIKVEIARLEDTIYLYVLSSAQVERHLPKFKLNLSSYCTYTEPYIVGTLYSFTAATMIHNKVLHE